MQVSAVSNSGYTGIDSLLSGDKWGGALGSGVNLTYSFPYKNGMSAFWETLYSPINEPWNYDNYGFNSTQQSAATQAVQQWANVANITFIPTIETSLIVGDIRLTFIIDPSSDDTWGWTYMPEGNSAASGDIWINSDVYNEDWAAGSYNFSSLMHELGHALGLKHPFEEGVTLPREEDSSQYSLMSYTEHPHATYREVTQDGDNYSWSYYDVQPLTPMLYDMAAMQYLYGANMEYNTGNDTYSCDPDTPFFATIWDAGGTDTISVANFSKGVLIDLQAGHFSSITIESDPLPENVTDIEPTYDGTDNLAIAFGVTIENATGGSGSDILIGNAANNMLNGGAGIDAVYYDGNRNDYLLTAAENGFSILDRDASSDTDTLIDIERIFFNDVNLALDLDGHAGKTAKILGAVFGADSISNHDYVEIGLKLLDDGMTYEDLTELAIGAAGTSGPTDIVALLWTNLFGSAPADRQAQPFIDLLNDGMSSGELGVLAADTELNQNNINLLGIMQTGLEFSV